MCRVYCSGWSIVSRALFQVDDGRGGFVLRARSDEVPRRRGSLVESSSNIKKVFKVSLVSRKGDILPLCWHDEYHYHIKKKSQELFIEVRAL